MVLSGIWEWRPGMLGGAGVAALLGVIALSTGGFATPRIGVPAWDLSAAAASAATLIDLAPEGTTVGARWVVASQLTALTNDVTPLAVFPETLERFGAAADPGFGSSDRAALMQILETGDGELSRLGELLDRFDIAAVCVARRARSAELGSALGEAGLVRQGRDRYCHFWVRQQEVDIAAGSGGGTG
jgi:hypothetical protein